MVSEVFVIQWGDLWKQEDRITDPAQVLLLWEAITWGGGDLLWGHTSERVSDLLKRNHASVQAVQIQLYLNMNRKNIDVELLNMQRPVA